MKAAKPPQTVFIEDCLETLCCQQDLSPHNDTVNHCLGSLVGYLSRLYDTPEFELLPFEPRLRHAKEELPRLCGHAECQMEKYWARKLCDNTGPLTEESLRTFWYFENYRILWESEQQLMQQVSGERLVFLGSGALPITAILAAWAMPDTPVLCVDFDPEACELARELIGRLGLHNQISVVCQPAEAVAYKSDDLVLCASLIENKDALFQKMLVCEVQRFMMRNVEGAFCFLYKRSEQPDARHYKALDKTETHPSRINNTWLFARIPASTECSLAA